MAADVSVCLQGGIAGVSFVATEAGSFLSIVSGAIAQLVEHLHGMQGVRSSSLLGSTGIPPSGRTSLVQNMVQNGDSGHGFCTKSPINGAIATIDELPAAAAAVSPSWRHAKQGQTTC